MAPTLGHSWPAPVQTVEEEAVHREEYDGRYKEDHDGQNHCQKHVTPVAMALINAVA